MDCMLPDTIDISTVLEAVPVYCEWLATSQPLTINASQVGKVDAAGIQALLALVITANKNNTPIQLIDCPTALREAIAILGFQANFESIQIVDEAEL
ncbi:STAS domain-containing protein [Vibrio sp.]|uniref:STAS domain-containing protein n=1 Tax=Vibrio sp. TaxID=678 RepID=UPI003D13167F